MFSPIPKTLYVVSFATLALGAAYSRTDNIVGAGFNSAFNYQAVGDPTHGRVYVSPPIVVLTWSVVLTRVQP